MIRRNSWSVTENNMLESPLCYYSRVNTACQLPGKFGLEHGKQHYLTRLKRVFYFKDTPIALYVIYNNCLAVE